MKIKLNIPERYLLIQVIPQKGTFETMSAIEALTKILYPSEVEVKKYGIEVKEDKIVWNNSAANFVEIEFTEKQIELIRKQLDEMSKDEKLDFNLYLIYKKFRENE